MTSATGLSDTGVQPGRHSSKRKFLVFTVMAFGMFMALIDIQIVAASLNDVQARAAQHPSFALHSPVQRVHGQPNQQAPLDDLQSSSADLLHRQVI